MAVPHPQQHDFSPLWLNFPTNTKSAESSQRAKSGFASLTPGRISDTSNWRIPSPTTVSHSVTPKQQKYRFNQDVNGNRNFKSPANFNGDFPSLQSEPAPPPSAKFPVDNGAWASPRNKPRQQFVNNVVKPNFPSTAPKPRMTYPSTGPRNVKLKLAPQPPPTVAPPEAEGPPSPKARVTKPDTGKMDFFKALRKEEGYEDVDLVVNLIENDRNIENTPDTEAVIEPLSSSVETEHRLLKEMGWCDDQEPPLTEEEMGDIKKEIEFAKRNKSPPTLKPFPWVTVMPLSDDNDDLSSSDDEY